MPPCSANVASEDYADFIYHYNNQPREQVYQTLKTQCVDFINNDYAVVYVPLSVAEPLSIERYTYNAIPKLYGLLDTTALEDAGITPVLNQPSLQASGTGTLIGLIDTGIDYQNPLFRNPDGTSRILGIWDQTLPPREEPGDVIQPFLYGSAFSKEDIDYALTLDDPFSAVPSADTNGHGTFMAGIAAGNTSENENFQGASPNSWIGMVKLKPAKTYLRDFFLIRSDAECYQENDIMTGIRYLIQLAHQYQAPLVIYIGLGTNQGSHDGTSPLSLQLQNLNGSTGLVAVTGAGNETGFAHHFFGSMPAEQVFEDVEIRVGAGERGFALELWAREPELYTVGFVSPTGEVIQRIPSIRGNETRISFLLDPTTITVSYQLTEVGSGSQLIFLRFETPLAGIWHIRVYSALYASGEFHMWLPMHGFLSDETVFLRPNPDTTITDPGNAAFPLTVSTYDHRNNSIYIHSSRGYTRGGRIKPELAAPGVNVTGPRISIPDLPGTSASNTLSLTTRTGSSIAAAIVAGAAANLLAWSIATGNDLWPSNATVRATLIRGADRNPGISYPNRIWGYGTLNLYQSFLRMRES